MRRERERNDSKKRTGESYRVCSGHILTRAGTDWKHQVIWLWCPTIRGIVKQDPCGSRTKVSKRGMVDDGDMTMRTSWQEISYVPAAYIKHSILIYWVEGYDFDGEFCGLLLQYMECVCIPYISQISDTFEIFEIIDLDSRQLIALQGCSIVFYCTQQCKTNGYWGQ